MEREKTVSKKTKFSEGEWDEIENAMREEGFRSFREYTLHMVETRRSRSDAEARRNQYFKYRCANLQTYYNQIRGSIDVERSMRRFMEEAGRICQGLK